VDEVKAKLPELPEAKRDRFMAEYGLPLYNATLLTSSKEMADYQESVAKALVESGKIKNSDVKTAARLASNWNLGEVSRILNEENIEIDYFSEKINPAQLGELLIAESQGVINTATAKSVLAEMYNTGKSAKDIIDEKGLSQITDSGEIEEAVRQALAANPQAIADFKKGKETAIKFLVGQVMRITRGRANPQLANELIERKLREE
jgi:aspartyl-tRNA(Asn)/glutamyl-tRNA(Gln) amidotransferase subunit B